MQRKDNMPTILAPGQADITYDYNKSSTGRQNSKDMLPYFIKLLKKYLIIFNKA